MSVRGEFLRCLGDYARLAGERGLLRVELGRAALPRGAAGEVGSLGAALSELRRLGAGGDLELAAGLTRRMLRDLAPRLAGVPGTSGPAGEEERRLRRHLDELCRVILGEPPARHPEEDSGAAAR